MTVLKYSDLADSGLYVKVSTKGQPNGVASLGSDGKVPSTQLPAISGGSGVLSFNSRTGAITLLASDIPGLDASKITSGSLSSSLIPGLDASKITSGVIDSARLPSSTGSSSLFTFRVNFASSSDGSPVAVQNLPTGWSATISGTSVTVTHNVNNYPKIVTFLGYNLDVAPAKFNYRTPSASGAPSIIQATQNTVFTFSITTALTASSLGQYALVNVSF